MDMPVFLQRLKFNKITMKTGKDFKIIGVSYGVIGDLIMGLPVLTYFEKKYPGSYRYFMIEQKVAFTAPLYFNHPLIDCIRITGEWSGFSKEDYEIANTCDIKCTMTNWKHDEQDWYNHRGQVEETARIAGIYDLKDVLTVEEMYPKLYKWFDVGEDDPNFQTYSKHNREQKLLDKTIAIWPFATAGDKLGRSPSVEWWRELVLKAVNMGYEIAQLGYKNEPEISSYTERYNHLTFFEQVKMALACKMVIGTDSGPMWVMGAYDHPAIHLMTNWLPGHTRNFDALTPVNNNHATFFEQGGTDNISQKDVLYIIERMMKA